jgi:F0F1-type ATP synthase membrane subunit b/b'
MAKVTELMKIIKNRTAHINEQINAIQKEMECAVLLLCSP